MEREAILNLGRDLYRWERRLLEECDLYLVGGVVRDLLMGKHVRPADEDYIALGIGMDTLVSILETLGTASLVGKSFGVIKFSPKKNIVVDISLPRTEFSTGPGHRDFEVSFDPSLGIEDDLVRRDFTINSMAFHLGSRRLVDPLGGRVDLERHVLRMNRPGSFREDPLRILRGVQFMARFGLAAEEGTGRIIRNDAPLLANVSPERVREELNKMMLLAERPGDGFVFMHETGILKYVLPELEDTHGIEQNEFHPDDIFHHSIRSCNEASPGLLARWSALLHDLGKKEKKREHAGRIVFYRHEEESAAIAGRVLSRFRFPNDFRESVVHLVRNHMYNVSTDWSDSAIRRYISRVGVENIGEMFALRMADARSRGDTTMDEEIERVRKRIDEIIESDAAFKRTDLAVDGKDVMDALGLEEGSGVGRILGDLLEMVLEDPSLNTREKLLGIIAGWKESLDS